MKKYFLLSILTLIIGSCNSNDQFSFDCNNKSTASISFDSINFEKINLPELETSYITFSEILNDKIYLADMKYCFVYEFDSIGFLQRKMLGKGQSRSELNTKIDGFCCNEPDEFIFIGSSNDVHIYKLDDDGLKIDTTIFFWEKLEGTSKLYRKSAAYTLLYDKLTIRKYKDKLYMPISGNHPIFNLFMPNYFKKTRIIRSLSLKNGEKQIMGGIPPIVNESDGRNQFFMFDYDIDSDGDFYVTYELDSLIYVFDNNFNLKESFGNKGKNIDFSTHKSLHIANYRSNYKVERETKSYYDNITKIGDFTFRTYRNSIDLNFDGLQVYDNYTLIADINIPRGFKVIGKIGDYYYSQVLSDEKDNKQFFYRFKL